MRSSSRTLTPRLTLIAFLALATACTSGPSGQSDAITTAYSDSAVRGDSVLRIVVALEDSIRRDSTVPETPRRLYQLGRLIAKNYLDLTRGLPDTAFKIGRDSMYFYNEIGGGYFYNGFHFREIERRFPADSFAAIGAFEAAFLPEGGECEGYVACYMARWYGPLEGFLQRHSRSPLAAVAIDSINAGWKRSLGFADSVRRENPEWVDTTDIRAVLARYDSAAAGLPAPLRYRARASLIPWLQQFGLKPRP